MLWIALQRTSILFLKFFLAFHPYCIKYETIRFSLFSMFQFEPEFEGKRLSRCKIPSFDKVHLSNSLQPLIT